MGTKRVKILVVEDNFMNKVLVKEMLTLHEYDVVEAGNGKEAIAKVLEEKPDLVLMDLNLPEMDGVTATKLIKEKKECRDMKVIALTAAAMKGDDEKLMSEGFDGYVQKPIELKKLLDAVDECLDSRKTV